MKVVAGICMALGLVCLGLSFAWPSLSGSMTQMTDEELNEFTAAAVNLHNNSSAQTQQQAMDEANKKAQEYTETMEKKERVKKTGVVGFRVCGVLFALVGVALQVWQNQKDA